MNNSILFKVFSAVGFLLCIYTVSQYGLSIQTITWMMVISSVWITACYLPQIFQLLRTKDARGISLDFWLNLDVALLALTINTTAVFKLYGTYGAMVTEILNLGLAGVVTVLVIKYKRRQSAS